MNLISTQWHAGFWGKAYVILLLYFLISTCIYIWFYYTQGSQRKMKFLLEAHKDGRYVPATISCYTLEGSFTETQYVAEYMYVVNGKRYFVTYQFDFNREMDRSKDKFESDAMLQEIKKYMILFYDKKNPKKVICKPEIFVSSLAMHKIHTNKKNRYRDTKKDWFEPIDIRR